MLEAGSTRLVSTRVFHGLVAGNSRRPRLASSPSPAAATVSEAAADPWDVEPEPRGVAVPPVGVPVAGAEAAPDGEWVGPGAPVTPGDPAAVGLADDGCGSAVEPDEPQAAASRAVAATSGTTSRRVVGWAVGRVMAPASQTSVGSPERPR